MHGTTVKKKKYSCLFDCYVLSDIPPSEGLWPCNCVVQGQRLQPSIMMTAPISLGHQERTWI